MMKKEEALKIIFECAKAYKENLSDKRVLILSASSSLKNVCATEVEFVKGNFLHMTGVKFINKPKIAPNAFFKLCVNQRLSSSMFDMAPDGTTELKLSILPSIVKKNMSANMIGDYSGVRPCLITDKLVGNTSAIVGFRNDKGGIYAPNTVLCEDIRTLTANKQRILAIYQKRIGSNKYEERVYLAKGIDWGKIIYPLEYQYLHPSQQD
ncbi:MAG: hypothetical protein IJ347_06705 [Faecalibacterium sp.]|nr:hypothetical protein [Faecalibacterium sp.]